MQQHDEVTTIPQSRPYIVCCVINSMSKCVTVPKSQRTERFIENNPSLFLPQRDDGLVLAPFGEEWYGN